MYSPLSGSSVKAAPYVFPIPGVNTPAKSSPAGIPPLLARPADDLSEVIVRSKRIEEPIPEIVVSGTRIPWYVWALLGGVAAAVLFSRK